MGYTYVKQHDTTDCGAACMAMICSYYKKNMNLTMLRDMMGTDDCGTNLMGMQHCAENLGFVSQAVRVDREGFFSRYPLPAVANIITKKGFSHFVVIFKISKERVIIGDPAKRILSLKIEEFFQKFTGILMLLEPGEEFREERGKKKGMLSQCREWLRPHWKLFVVGMTVTAVVLMLQLSNSAMYYLVYDKILPSHNQNALLSLLAVFWAVILAQGLLGSLQRWMSVKLSQKIDIPLMASYVEHIYHLPVKFFASRRTGDMVNRISDAFAIKELYTKVLPSCMINLAMALFSGIVMFLVNKKLFCMCLLFNGINGACGLLIQKKMGCWKEKQVKQSGEVSSQMVEGVFAMDTIKANACEQMQVASITKEYGKLIGMEYKMGVLSSIQNGLQEMLSGSSILLLLYYGICQVMEGSISLGSLMAFMTLSGCFQEPFKQLAQMQFALKETDISRKRVTEVLEYPKEEREELKTLTKVEGDVVFQHVTFGYGVGQPVLEDISFCIPKGKRIALVGGSGSGKSTIAKLLLKYYDVEQGAILVGGVNLEQYAHSSVRKAVAYVPQNMQLFSKSIYENIAVSRPKATKEEIIEAAKYAGAHEFIVRLPKQYDTCLEEGGSGLSVGERQRIILARAFLKKSSFMILDESTSNLDYATEHNIFARIYQEFPDTSMLIIAHRLSTVKDCDEILVMHQGKIVEQGTHEELLQKESYYYELWKMQR